jgi:hypothetical protein
MALSSRVDQRRPLIVAVTSDNETIRCCVTAYAVTQPRTPDRELQGLRSDVRQMATSAGFALAARMPERSP